jgi:hypothetical protein
MIPSWLLPMLGNMMGGGTAAAGGAAAGTGLAGMAGMNPATLAMMAGPEILKMFPAFKGDNASKAYQGVLPIWYHLMKQSGMGPFGGGLIGGIKGLLSGDD